MHFIVLVSLAAWLRKGWDAYIMEHTDVLGANSICATYQHISRILATMPHALRIVLPKPGPAANPNGNRAHYFKISKERKKTRGLAKAYTIHVWRNAVERPQYPDQFTSYRYIWNYYGTQLPDDDNIIARCKSIKDGVCDALGINDRNLRNHGVTFIRDKQTQGTVTIILE